MLYTSESCSIKGLKVLTLVTRYNGLCRTPDFEIHPYCSSSSAASGDTLPNCTVHSSICSLTSTAAVDVAIKWSLGEKLMSVSLFAGFCRSS